MRSLTAAMAIVAVWATTAQAQISDLLRSQLAQSAAMRAPGAQPVGAPIGGLLSGRQSITEYVTMQAGRCYTVLGVGGQGVADLDLVLYNPNGKRVASDIGFDPTPSLQHCANWPGAYRLEATIKRGAGEVAVQVYAAGGGSEVPSPPPVGGDGMPPPDPSLQARAQPAPAPGGDALAAHVDAQAAALAPGSRRVGELFAGVADKGRKNDWFVPLEAGHCYTFIAAGGMGVQFLSQFLWDPSGRRVSDNKSKSAESVMAFCAGIPGPYHLQVKIERGAGEFRVGVYAKQ